MDRRRSLAIVVLVQRSPFYYVLLTRLAMQAAAAQHVAPLVVLHGVFQAVASGLSFCGFRRTCY
jgi:hypothetical protein